MDNFQARGRDLDQIQLIDLDPKVRIHLASFVIKYDDSLY